MPNARGKNKAKHHRRTPRTSKGLRRHSKHPLTTVQKVLMKKGLYQSFEPLGGRTR